MHAQLETSWRNCVSTPPDLPSIQLSRDLFVLTDCLVRSFFQSVCVMGYCLFPLTIAALINVFVHTFFVRLPVIAVTYCWSAFGMPSLLVVIRS